ncbi:MAG TPA: hypothetical protein VMR88_10265 [Candidatus Polarisedimenticolaceae bacterium]|nr:hypothetical protein [Candidatus Polarisedimenticolaceae bacterium]
MIKQCAVWFCGLFLMVVVSILDAQEQPKIAEYRDPEYAYSFQYPADWKLKKLPEGAANDDVRVSLQTPSGDSFMVIVEKRGQNPTKAEFQSDPNRSVRIDKLIDETTQEIYRTVARNLGAVETKFGEKTDLSNDDAIKFYVSSLNKMKVGEPVIVAGIHSYPFSKPYSISFMMTAFFNPGAEKENALMRAVFNSFQLMDPAGSSSEPTSSDPPKASQPK